jgi:hypothetical protein
VRLQQVPINEALQQLFGAGALHLHRFPVSIDLVGDALALRLPLGGRHGPHPVQEL